MNAAQLNSVLRRAEKRALELEPEMVAVLTPLLNQAGRDAAAAFSRRATNFLTADAGREADAAALLKIPPGEFPGVLRSLALVAAAPGVTAQSTMIAVKPTAEEAAALAQDGGEPAENLHVTLAFLGETDGPLEEIAELLRPVAAVHAPLRGVVGGIGAFGAGDQSPAILLPDVPGLVELRVAVTEALTNAGVSYGRDHGFAAHVTVGYNPTPVPAEEAKLGLPLSFTGLLVVRGDTEIVEVPLVGRPPLTAAGEGRSRWGAPDPAEVVDVPRLVAAIRARTDPVRRAVIETVMTEPLEATGLSFDVTNPLTAEVLAQSASQVTHIAETTQLNVMKTISEAYSAGLSIPQTAEVIRKGMVEATPARARLIARTELAGAVNGGSLAATRIVSAAIEKPFWKQWMTAPYAAHPRHNTYTGLNGQTVRLSARFNVGGYELDHPGDPAGPPREICNCRCSMGYTEDAPLL